jgi:hypothetical protein
MEPITVSRPLQSEAINEIAAALASAQGEMVNATKTSDNPYFRSRYADLAAVWDAIRAPLSKHGLSVTQTFRRVAESAEYTVTRTAKTGETWESKVQHLADLVTTLHHASGQWIGSEVPIICEWGNPQTLGSTITYLRRYSLQAACGIAPEDDDGNAASVRDQDQAHRSQGYQDRSYQRPSPQPVARHASAVQPVQRGAKPVAKTTSTPSWEPGSVG